MRPLLLFTLFLVAFSNAPAQSHDGALSVNAMITGCWQAGDGGMEGQYCFDQSGLLRIKPKGRIALQRGWEYDPKKQLLVVRKGGKPIKYVVEMLNDTAFVLFEQQHDVRLVGKRSRN